MMNALLHSATPVTFRQMTMRYQATVAAVKFTPAIIGVLGGGALASDVLIMLPMARLAEYLYTQSQPTHPPTRITSHTNT